MIDIEEGGPVTCIRFAGGMTGGDEQQRWRSDVRERMRCGVQAKRGSSPASSEENCTSYSLYATLTAARRSAYK